MPSAASLIAVPAPMPRAAPVTIAIFCTTGSLLHPNEPWRQAEKAS
jgi:hypothetical protein